MNLLKWTASASGPGQPWLKTEAWRRREIVDGSRFHGLALVLAYVFFGGSALLIIWALLDPPKGSSGNPFEGLVLAVTIIVVLAVLTYWWRRHNRYGNSVCRLLTLPGVVGGWFKADVECALPADSAEPVIARLRVIDLDRKGTELWRTEHTLTVPVVEGKRAIVPVRLSIPRHPRMLLSQIEFTEYMADGRCAWVLEIEKKTSGVDFLATFCVPVYDTQNAPPAEQQAD